MKAFKLLCAAALVSALPMAASAATVTLQAGGTTSIALGNDYEYVETVTAAGAGSTSFDLQATPPQQIKLDSQFVTLEFAGMFENLMIELTNMSGVTTATQIVDSPTVRAFSLATIFNSVNGFTQNLTVSWSGIAANANGATTAQFNIQALPSAVPVPAAGLLLVTALGGAAALRRRKKAVAA